MFVINQRSREPIFEQLQTQIIQYISLGVLKTGDRLPSVRVLAAELGINPNTVVKAYLELEKEGILITAPKKGYFVGGGDMERILQNKKLAQMQEMLHDCKASGIPKEAIIQLTTEVYREELGGDSHAEDRKLHKDI